MRALQNGVIERLHAPPRDYVEALRAAFAKTSKDPDSLVDAPRLQGASLGATADPPAALAPDTTDLPAGPRSDPATRDRQPVDEEHDVLFFACPKCGKSSQIVFYSIPFPAKQA